MNEHELRPKLDRRAEDAVAAVDEAVAKVPVPEPELGSPSLGVRRFLPMAVAAGLAVIALVGVTLMFDDADEQGTVAGQPEGITRLALPDPASSGHRIVGAFVGPSNAPSTDFTDLTVTLHAPPGAQTWEKTAISYSMPADMTTLAGETVDVGGPEAVVRQSDGIPMIGWSEGDRVRYVGADGRTVGELVVLVKQVISDDVRDGAPLPGHEIIHVAPYTDLYPMMVLSDSMVPADGAGVAYESDGDTFVVTTTAGSELRWRASSVLAVDTERITVRGQDAVRADFESGLTEVSWLEPDRTLVRVASFRKDVPLDLLEQLEPISDAHLAELVDEYGTEGRVTEHDIDETGEETEAASGTMRPGSTVPEGSSSPTTRDERLPLAEVSIDEDGLDVRARLLRGPDGSIHLETSTTGPTGGSGVGRDLPDISTNEVIRNHASLEPDEMSGELIAGVIGPSAGTIEFIDPATGAPFDPVGTSGPSHAKIPDSDYVLFLGTIAPEHRGRPIAVVTTSRTGEQVRLDA